MTLPCTILWAEDDPDDIELILEASRDLRVDHLIEFVRNGQEALNKLLISLFEKTLPQLIVLDNNMPVMSGAEAFTRILRYEQLKDIPVVIFTTGKTDAELHLLQYHAQIFEKPTTYANFIKTMEEILKLCHSSDN